MQSDKNEETNGVKVVCNSVKGATPRPDNSLGRLLLVDTTPPPPSPSKSRPAPAGATACPMLPNRVPPSLQDVPGLSSPLFSHQPKGIDQL
ncbi:hypothetical protein RRG08_054707 [Elysia crispata]|uniref:Uncharacterized protein n=1 Tax=Elysia crispata TaxID=231223 RepID=A0AAE1B1N2_9GAST|nr:hypothetical protein RRG08_054707 [Elysia crispata]